MVKTDYGPKGGFVPSMTRAFWRRDAIAEPHGWVYASLDMGGASPPDRKLNSYIILRKEFCHEALPFGFCPDVGSDHYFLGSWAYGIL